MARRRRRKREPCRNCTEPKVDKKPLGSQFSNAQLDARVVNNENEGERLWRHVCYGTGTCIGMLEGYAALNVPGDPLPQLHSLAQRLMGVIITLEHRKKKSEDQTPKDAGPAAQSDLQDAEGRLQLGDDAGSR